MKSVLYRGRIADELDMDNRFGRTRKNFLIESVRELKKWFDGQIVLSTWKGQEKYITDEKLFDKIIFLDEPNIGPVGFLKKQVYSLKEGLKHCDGDLILSTRCDIIFKKNIFEKYENFEYNNNIFKIFNKRILTCSHMSIDPDFFLDSNKHFRTSDWFHLGYKDDLYKLSNILEIIDSIPKKNIKTEPYYHFDNCMCCEQLWNLCLIKKYILNFDFCDTSYFENNHWDFILNNYIIKNTTTDLGAVNMCWETQPENLNFYITHTKYKNKFLIQKNDTNLQTFP
jgi:hypothetical protein